MRVDQDADAQDIAQNTWEAIHQKLALYDPARGSLRAFVRYWAKIMLLRYYDARGARRKVEVLFSELRARYPDLEEEDLGELVDRLPKQSHPSVEEEVISAEDAMRLAQACDQLLRITFDGPSPPHQLPAFGFCKLLEWEPRKVVACYSDRPLRNLVEQLVREYGQEASLAEQRLRACFARLRQQMDQPLGEAIADETTRHTYRSLLDRLVGDTTLREYYTNPHEPTANIAQWWYAVRRRVLSAAKRQGIASLAALLMNTSSGGRRDADESLGTHKGARRDARRVEHTAYSSRRVDGLLRRHPLRGPRGRDRRARGGMRRVHRAGQAAPCLIGSMG